jgi:hypothetical protein
MILPCDDSRAGTAGMERLGPSVRARYREIRSSSPQAARVSTICEDLDYSHVEAVALHPRRSARSWLPRFLVRSMDWNERLDLRPLIVM